MNLRDGAHVDAFASGGDDSVYAYGVFTDCEITTLNMDSAVVEANAESAYSAYAKGVHFYSYTEDEMSMLNSEIKATATIVGSDHDDTWSYSHGFMVSAYSDFTLVMDSSLVSASSLSATSSVAKGVRLKCDVAVDNFTLNNSSSITATATGEEYAESYALYTADGNTTITTLSLDNGSLLRAQATTTGDESFAEAYGAYLYGTDIDTFSLENGSSIDATAIGPDSESYGIYSESSNFTVTIDATSSISGDWAIYDDDNSVIVENSGLLAGRVEVHGLTTTASGILKATFGSDDGFSYVEGSADDYYSRIGDGDLADGTTFLLNPTDDFGLSIAGDSFNYALLIAEGDAAWTNENLNLATTTNSSLLGLSWYDDPSTNKLIVTATFLTSEEAGLSGNGTDAYEAAVDAGVFTFASDPDEWTPNVSGAFVAGMTQSLGTSHFNIGNRMGALMGMNSGDDVVANNGMWFSVRFTEAEQDKRDSVVGFDSDTAGLSIGIDREFGDTVLGFAYTRGTTDADANDNSADFDMTDNLFSLYGSYDAGAWYSEAILSAGFGSVDGERHVGSDVYASDYDSNSYNAKVEMGMKLNQQGWQINPLFALQYSVKEYDSYTETGSGDLALSVKSQEYSTFTAGLGAAIQKEFQRNWGTFTPEFRGTVNYDIENDRIVSTANFVGGSTSFVAKGVEPSETSWDLGAALTVASLGEENVSFRVGYDYSGREDFEAHSFTGKIRFEF